MSENNSKSTHNDYCNFCGNKISEELSKKIKANKDNVVCELCGCQLLLITNISKEENRGTELKTDIKKEHQEEIREELKELYSLNIYSADREKFGYYLTIFMSRSIYNIIKQSNLGINITDIHIEMISNSIIIEIINNRIINSWLAEIKPIKRNFKKCYRELQSELSLNQTLQEVFLEFFRLLAKIIINLINKKDYSELQGIEYDIAEYLIKRDLFGSSIRFTVPFRYNLKICLSRLIYLRIKDIASKNNLKFRQLKLSNIENRNISDEIMKYLTAHNEIINKFLGELEGIKPDDFNEFYEYLCLELKSDNLFAESFNYYLRWLIGHVHNIVSGKYKWRELSHFDRIIGSKLAQLINVELDFEKIRGFKENVQNTVEIAHENLINPEVNELSAEIKNDNFKLLKMSSGYNPPEKRIKVRKVVLKIIQKELKNRGFTIVDIDNKIGYCFKNALYYNSTFALNDFNKLKELVDPKNLIKIFKINDIPHKIIVGKSLQERIILEESDDVAKLVSLLIGDGHLSENGHVISISFNGVDESYYVEYTKKLIRKIFKDVHIQEKWDRNSPNSSGKEKGLTLTITSVSIHESLVAKGLIPGDKIKNQVKVPSWIFKKRSYKLSCLKELFDTDGSIFIDKNHKTVILNFTSGSKPLVQDFYKICNQLTIRPAPKIVKRKVDESKYNPRFQINIIAKDQVRKFLELIKPTKFEDPYRRVYLGTQLIYLSKSKETIDAIEKKIRKKFPRESERKFSKDFTIFLKKTCEDQLGFKIKKEDIDKSIENSLVYEICIYTKEKAKYFKNLYEQMGNLEYVKEYLIEQWEDIIPIDDTINNFIKKYIKIDENNLNYDNWLGKFRSRTINVDKRTNNINRFPRKQRSIINFLVYQILNETSKDLSNSEILELLIEKLKKSNMILIPWLIKNNKYSAALIKYINNLITLIKDIFIPMKRNKNIGGKFLKEKLQLPFSVARINEMIRDLKENINIK